MTKGVTWTYTYDINGLRTGRTDGTNTYEYIYAGDKLVRMIRNGEVVDYGYAGGQLATMTYDGATYYYVLNGQGDVIALTDNAGRVVIGYTYGAYGSTRLLLADENLTMILKDVNPFMYRGYIYDFETQLYYLQSRYYDPNMGRFINADSHASTGQGVLGANMFAYCNNNPASSSDPSGYCGGGASTVDNDFSFSCVCPNCAPVPGYGGGGGMLLAMEELATRALGGVAKAATWAVATIAYASASVSGYVQDPYALRLADQSPPDGQYQYWEACWQGKKVLVGRGLSVWEASLRVACGQNVMCANQDAARWLVKINRYHNAIGPEVGGGEGFYWHYHPHRETEVHIWFYGGVYP